MKNTIIKDLSADALHFLEDQKKLHTYDVQEQILRDLVRRFPDHSNYDGVEVKAKLLNLFYSTGIQAIDKVVEKIMSIKNIDEVLLRAKYNKELVDTIAKLELADGKVRINYSFATKYCALHQPNKYPIFDSIVEGVLETLMLKGELPPFNYKKGAFEEKLRDYDFFVQVYDRFMECYGLKGKLTYRDVDWYLWGSYKQGETQTEIERLTQLDMSLYSVYVPKKINQSIIIK